MARIIDRDFQEVFQLSLGKVFKTIIHSTTTFLESDADERFPSPEPEPERPTVLESDEEEEEIIPATPQERGRKRVRKPIDQTFVDEDGFIRKLLRFYIAVEDEWRTNIDDC